MTPCADPLRAQPAPALRPRASAAALRVRPVQPDDRAAMAAFVAALSPLSRRRRFHGAVSAHSERLLRHLVAADGGAQRAWVAVLHCDDGAECVVGEARYVPCGRGGAQAELALTVADAWQGRGVAAQLMDELLRAAAAAGVQRLHGDVQDDNAPMLAFLRRRGFVPVAEPAAEAAAGVRLARSLPHGAGGSPAFGGGAEGAPVQPAAGAGAPAGRRRAGAGAWMRRAWQAVAARTA